MTDLFAGAVSARFPRLAGLLGRQLEGRSGQLERLRPAVLWQMERDLELLARHRSQEELARAYHDALQNPTQLIGSMYEIRVAAALAPFVDGFELAPKVGAGRCDLKCNVRGNVVYVEVSVREDKFPPEYWTDATEGPPLYGRATVERSFNPTSGEEDPVPASQELRERIAEELGQLPHGEMTVVVLGNPGGHSVDMEQALEGDELLRGRSGRAGLERVLSRNGLFSIPDDVGGLSRLSAVVWMKLVPHFYDVRVHSRVFTNPQAAVPLSQAAVDLFRGAFDRRRTLLTELERIKAILAEKYLPERIILFGSLAEELASGRDRVHAESDIDLAIVKVTSSRFIDRPLEVSRLVEPRVGLNVVVYTPKEIEQAEREGNFFVRDEIVKKGQVIFP